LKTTSIIIENVSTPRAGWSEAATQLADQKEDQLLDEPLPNEFDESEWTW
jgi:hypothetical protein